MQTFELSGDKLPILVGDSIAATNMGLHRKGKIPFSQKIGITPASTHDLTALKPVLEATNIEAIFLNKAYCDQELAKKMTENDNCLLAPVKKSKEHQ